MKKAVRAHWFSVIWRACHSFWSATGIHPRTPFIHCLHKWPTTLCQTLFCKYVRWWYSFISCGPSVHSLIFYINHDLQCLSEWLEDNNLVLNVSKTKCVLFTSQRHKERDCILNLDLLGKSISCETSFKYLGVVFDSFMSLKAHADYVCKRWRQELTSWAVLEVSSQKRQQHLFITL